MVEREYFLRQCSARVRTDPEKAEIPQNASAPMALCGALYKLVSDVNLNAVGAFAIWLRRELGGSLVGACVRREPAFQGWPAFTTTIARASSPFTPPRISRPSERLNPSCARRHSDVLRRPNWIGPYLPPAPLVPKLGLLTPPGNLSGWRRVIRSGC